MKRLISLILPVLLLSALLSNGSDFNAEKSGKIRGVVFDKSSGQPMEYAQVTVYNLKDSTLISGNLSNQNGEFEIARLKNGDYYLEANFIGFHKKRISNIKITDTSPVFETGKIELASAELELEGVNVIADKKAIEFKLDKKVVNVSQVFNAVGGTAVEALENVPSVQVDIEGNVTLRGSSDFTVFVDGRPSVLTGSDALRQIPASAIENIEIITNPSAKYDPDGMAGIINLVMKKNIMLGFSGIANATIGSRSKYRGDFTLNYRTNSFNAFVGADWRDETNFGKMSSYQESFAGDTTNVLDMSGQQNETHGGHNLKAGIDFFLSKKTTLSLSGEAGKSTSSDNGTGQTHSFSTPQTKDVHSVTGEISGRNEHFYTLIGNFQHNFNNLGHKLEAMAFYSDEDGTDTEEESEILADQNYVKIGSYLDRVMTAEGGREKDFRFKADYILPLKNEGKFEAGVQSRIEREYEDIAFKDYIQATDSWITNNKFSSSTDFKNDIHAVYSTFSSSIGKMEYMAGLRGELTVRDIINTNIPTSTFHKFDIFPTMHLSYKFKNDDELIASYSRRITRPGGRDLDPAPSYFNRYMISIGNPNLKPEYTNSYDLGLMKRFDKSYISLDLFHRITNNRINRIQSLGQDGIYYQLVDNFNKDYSTGLEIMGNLSIDEWLVVNASASGYNYRITGTLDGESVDRNSTNWTGRMNTTIRFTPGSRMQVTGFYRGSSVTIQGKTKAAFFSNLSFRQDFLRKTLTATVSIQDIFGTAKSETWSYGNNFTSHSVRQREPRVFMFTLSYKLNNFGSSEEEGGDEEEGNNEGIIDLGAESD